MSRSFLYALCAVAAIIVSTAYAETIIVPQATAPQRVPLDTVKEPQVQRQEKGAPADVLNLTPKQAEKKDAFDLFSGGPAGYLLSQYLKTTVDFAPDAPRRQRMALNELQKATPGVKQQMVSELVAAYQRLPEGDYDRRWLLIDTLAQLVRREAAEHLATIALSALPPERLMRKGAEWSSRDEEVSIRLAAVRGLALLSSMQVSAADAKLVSIASRSTLTAIRKQAIQGYLDAPARSAKTGAVEVYRKSPVFNRRLSDLKRQLPPDAQKLADEVTAVMPDISTPEEIRKAVQDRKTRKVPQKSDSPPAVRKGGQQ